MCVCAAGASVRVCVCVFLLDSSRGGVGGNLYLQNVLTILYGVCVYVPLRHSRWLADLQRVCVCLCVRVHAGSVNRVNRLISTLPPLFFFFFFSPLPFLFGPFICRSSSPPRLQPGFEEINPEWKTSLERRKKIKGSAA